MLTVGTDIEVWAAREDHDGSSWRTSNIVPAYYAIGDSVIPLPHGHAYPDGAAVEFTVTPSHSATELARKIRENMEEIAQVLAKEGLHIALNSNGFIGLKNISKIPIELNEWGEVSDRSKRICLQVLGCSPDLNVYDDLPQRPNPSRYPYRTLGGHIHIGLPEDVMESDLFELIVPMLVISCDLSIGTFAAHVARTPGDVKRRVLYGKAGTYRVKPYGVEYRVPPAKLLTWQEKYASHTFQLALDSAERVLERITEIDYDSPIIEQLFGIDREKLEAIKTYVNTSVASSEVHVHDTFAPISEQDANYWRG